MKAWDENSNSRIKSEVVDLVQALYKYEQEYEMAKSILRTNMETDDDSDANSDLNSEVNDMKTISSNGALDEEQPIGG